MCLGLPGRIVDVGRDAIALVDIGGMCQRVDLGLLEVQPGPGEWVVVHVGFALARLTEEEAAEALDALVTKGPGLIALEEAAGSETGL